MAGGGLEAGSVWDMHIDRALNNPGRYNSIDTPSSSSLQPPHTRLHSFCVWEAGVGRYVDMPGSISARDCNVEQHPYLCITSCCLWPRRCHFCSFPPTIACFQLPVKHCFFSSWLWLHLHAVTSTSLARQPCIQPASLPDTAFLCSSPSKPGSVTPSEKSSASMGKLIPDDSAGK